MHAKIHQSFTLLHKPIISLLFIAVLKVLKRSVARNAVNLLFKFVHIKVKEVSEMRTC